MTLQDIKFNEKHGINYDKIVIFLHGLGSNSADLMSLAPELHKSCQDQEVLFLSVNAPYEFDFSSNGYQWFSLKDWDENRIYSEIKLSAQMLEKYIEEAIIKYNSKYEKIFLIGFSQGAMMSLYIAPRLEDKIGGVIALSGRLLKPEILAYEIKSRPKIMLNHGKNDEIVPYSYMLEAKEILEKNKFDVKSYSNNTGHIIDFEAVKKIKDFLNN